MAEQRPNDTWPNAAGSPDTSARSASPSARNLLFLSYPPEDVRGFIEHRDQGCKCVGCWKVYGDVRPARKKFAQYQQCTDCYLRQNARGCPLERLAVQTVKS